MRVTQLRQADLNLLVVFTTLAEERNVSRAAKRLFLSQPAVTRALQRLRETFHDDLLVRVSGNYELTGKGAKLLAELEDAFPRLDRLLAGPEFDPKTESALFHLVGTDYAARVVGVPLAQYIANAGPQLSLEIAPLSDSVFEAMDRARVDLVLQADHGNIPSHLTRECLFKDRFSCVVAADTNPPARFGLPQYLERAHVGVAIFGGAQTVPDQRLAAAGHKRFCPVKVAHFSVAMSLVVGTNLVATIPKRFLSTQPVDPKLAYVPAPALLGTFEYMMIWHPRLEHDAAHIWLRDAVRTKCGLI